MDSAAQRERTLFFLSLILKAALKKSVLNFSAFLHFIEMKLMLSRSDSQLSPKCMDVIFR